MRAVLKINKTDCNDARVLSVAFDLHSAISFSHILKFGSWIGRNGDSGRAQTPTTVVKEL